MEAAASQAPEKLDAAGGCLDSPTNIRGPQCFISRLHHNVLHCVLAFVDCRHLGRMLCVSRDWRRVIEGLPFCEPGVRLSSVVFLKRGVDVLHSPLARQIGCLRFPEYAVGFGWSQRMRDLFVQVAERMSGLHTLHIGRQHGFFDPSLPLTCFPPRLCHLSLSFDMHHADDPSPEETQSVVAAINASIVAIGQLACLESLALDDLRPRFKTGDVAAACGGVSFAPLIALPHLQALHLQRTDPVLGWSNAQLAHIHALPALRRFVIADPMECGGEEPEPKVLQRLLRPVIAKSAEVGSSCAAVVDANGDGVPFTLPWSELVGLEHVEELDAADAALIVATLPNLEPLQLLFLSQLQEG